MKNRGITLVEILVAMGISTLLTSAVVWFLVTSLRSNTIIWDQLTAQADGRRVLQTIVDDVRRAEQSSIGAYPIEQASTSSLTIFANIDSDSYRERVRYWLVGTTVKRGIVKPNGTPLQYVTSSEQVVDIAHAVANLVQNTPLFQYYGQGYTGAEPPLTLPVTTTDIRLLRIQVDIEKDIGKSPVPLHMESVVQLRNLKSN